MNIIYIRAAIEEATGIKLPLKEVKQLLIEEGLVSEAKAKHLIFRGYSEFYDYFYKQDKNVIEATQKKQTPLDVFEYFSRESDIEEIKEI
jgi:hypothetical protein